MARVEAVPAGSLVRQLEVPSCRAALFTVPFPLVDAESVAPVLVGQAHHAAPDVDIAIRAELVEMILAVGVGCRVARIGLHIAVSAFGLVNVLIILEVLHHVKAVLHHLPHAWLAGWLDHRPLVWERRQWWGWGLSERTARQQG